MILYLIGGTGGYSFFMRQDCNMAAMKGGAPSLEVSCTYDTGIKKAINHLRFALAGVAMKS